MLAEADTYLSGRGLRDRVELVEGDMFDEVRAEADVYVLKNVLHDWDDAACLKILATVRGAMRPGTRLVLVEQLQERNDPHPFASLTDLQMMTQVDGRPGALPRGAAGPAASRRGCARARWSAWRRAPSWRAWRTDR